MERSLFASAIIAYMAYLEPEYGQRNIPSLSSKIRPSSAGV